MARRLGVRARAARSAIHHLRRGVGRVAAAGRLLGRAARQREQRRRSPPSSARRRPASARLRGPSARSERSSGGPKTTRIGPEPLLAAPDGGGHDGHPGLQAERPGPGQPGAQAARPGGACPRGTSAARRRGAGPRAPGAARAGRRRRARPGRLPGARWRGCRRGCGRAPAWPCSRSCAAGPRGPASAGRHCETWLQTTSDRPGGRHVLRPPRTRIRFIQKIGGTSTTWPKTHQRRVIGGTLSKSRPRSAAAGEGRRPGPSRGRPPRRASISEESITTAPVGHAQRAGRPGAVELVAAADVLQHLRLVELDAARGQLGAPAARALLRGGGEEDLEVGVGPARCCRRRGRRRPSRRATSAPAGRPPSPRAPPGGPRPRTPAAATSGERISAVTSRPSIAHAVAVVGGLDLDRVLAGERGERLAVGRRHAAPHGEPA